MAKAGGPQQQQHCIFELKSSHDGQTIKRLECHDHSNRPGKNRDNFSPSSSSKSDQPETEPLLSPTSSSNNTNSHNICWTLSGAGSDYWKVSSEILLRVFYRPSFTSTPAYTNISYCRDAARRASCRYVHQSIDYYSVTYTTEDILQMDDLDEIRIRGIGTCRAIRLRLKSKEMHVPIAANDDARTQVELEKQFNLKEHLTHDWDRLEERADTLTETITKDDNQHKHDGPTLVFAMPKDTRAEQTVPPLLWKVFLPENRNVSLETVTILQGSLDAIQDSPTHVYINGYQSWSYAGSLTKGKPQPGSALPNVFSKAFNLGGSPPPRAGKCHTILDIGDKKKKTQQKVSDTPFPEKPYRSDFFACITSDGISGSSEEQPSSKSLLTIDETGGPALVAGWLSQHWQYGLLEISKDLMTIAMHVSFDNVILKKSMETDWAYVELVAPHGFDEEPMAHYLHTVAAHNVARPLQNGPMVTGWCSWYHYYEKITAGNLRENFFKLSSIRDKFPTNAAIVDDGYMTAWGDWHSLKPNKFPAGLKGVAEDIVANGMRPGLWMAPFAADKHSKLAKQHPDWLIRNDEGRLANSSFCGKFFCGLDVTNPHVREYVYSCIRRAVVDWGYTVLKIDFLYASCLKGNGKYDLSISRSQAMTLALQCIRSAAGPDVYLIGCGCPIGPGIGYVDANRISADTGPSFYPEFPLPYWDNGTLPSLRAMIRNSMSRAPLGHRWWHNDPDCLLLGTTTKLTYTQIASAASVVAMTSGMLLLSDDLTQVPKERMEIVSKIFPITGATAIVLDLHSTKFDGLPTVLRLWCTDRRDPVIFCNKDKVTMGFNHEATMLARQASFSPDSDDPIPSRRVRNCIHVPKGMGTWTVVSISNWKDDSSFARIPLSALLPGWKEESDSANNAFEKINADGFHVFFFWSGDYSWVPDPRSEEGENYELRKLLKSHETEIIHLKPVSHSLPDYIGSTIHFSCGYEVRRIDRSPDHLTVQLRNDFHRLGSIYLYIPRLKFEGTEVTIAGKKVDFQITANTPSSSTSSNSSNQKKMVGRIIRVAIEIQGDQSPNDGEIIVKF